jgi:rhamnosyltransferase
MQIPIFKIACVVVLYNPYDEVLTNIRSYQNLVGKVFVIDNSENKNEALILKLKAVTQIEYIDNGGNKGIANALNRGALKAVADDFRFLLTMDQDSSFERNNIEIFIEALNKVGENESLGILSSCQENIPYSTFTTEFSEVKSTMTSGNLLNLNAYKITGHFNEEYFIDYVDHEYCLRLRRNGFKIIRANEVKLDHNLGNITYHTIFGFRTATSNHTSLRRYYMARNKLRTVKLFLSYDPLYCMSILFSEMEELIKVILFEQDKVNKLKFAFLGYRDFLIGRYGKFR